MKPATKTSLTIALILFALGISQQKGCEWPDVSPILQPSEKATAATYFYEKDQTAIPAAVMSGINKLNLAGIVATTCEANPDDGTGDVPDQYKIPLAAAREAGLPALVVMAGDKVLRVVKNPATLEQVVEAAQ